jgi:hypothetical protein
MRNSSSSSSIVVVAGYKNDPTLSRHLLQLLLILNRKAFDLQNHSYWWTLIVLHPLAGGGAGPDTQSTRLAQHAAVADNNRACDAVAQFDHLQRNYDDANA